MNRGVVYLIHFDSPVGNLKNPRGKALHYLGYAFSLEDRLARHMSGFGSHLMAAVVKAGIPWRVVKTWRGGRKLERKLKNQKNAPRLCPVCNRNHLERDEQ